MLPFQQQELDQTKVILRSAYELLSDKTRWTKNASAKNVGGFHVEAWSDMAIKWCASGAIHKYAQTIHPTSYAHIVSIAEDMLCDGIRNGEGLVEEYVTIPAVNDGRRGYARIMAGFRWALGLDTVSMKITGTINAPTTTDATKEITLNVPR